MSLHVSAGTPHTYRANEHDTVLSEVSDVHCVLMPRALLVAGFDTAGSIMMARYNSYAATDPAWAPEFFEHEFINEPLLGVPQQVKAIAVGSREELLIPKEQYEEGAARSWMESLHAICPDDVVYTYEAESAKALSAFALPARMDKLLHRYFGQTDIIPVGAFQLYKPNPVVPYLLQCLISPDTVMATLHNKGRLLWRQQFVYSGVEDIAWQIAHLCRELRIPHSELQLECTMLSEEGFDLCAELERYFPKIKWSSGNASDEGRWSPVLYLLKQLYACAL